VNAGQDMRLGYGKIKDNRNFCNKLWNVARYIQMTAGESAAEAHPGSLADHWILNKLSILTEEINEDIDNFRFSEAYQALYHFVWDDLADWYVEASKTEPNRELLKYVLESSLVLLHPFAPFITEAIWRQLGHEDLLAEQLLPAIQKANEEEALKFNEIKKLVSEVRRIKIATKVNKPSLFFLQAPVISEHSALIIKMAKLDHTEEALKPNGFGIRILGIQEQAWLDIGHKAASDYFNKLQVNKSQKLDSIRRLKERLDNKSYVENAPKELVDETRQNLADEVELLKQLEEEISTFQQAQT
jgi:valyl-tRNA synthetase